MKKIYFLFISVIFALSVSAQVTDTTKNAENKKPVRDVWSCNLLIDDQTTNTPEKGGLEFLIQHRFSDFASGPHALYGLYGTANILLGVNYGLTRNLMIGFGTEKENQDQEFLIKYKLLDQNKGGSIPVSISLFGNASINTNETSYFGENYKAIDRLSYFGELIISRKFTKAISLEAAANWSHINKVESISDLTTSNYPGLYKNDALGLTAAGRVKVYHDISVIAKYDQGFYLGTVGNQQLEPTPNFGLGFEVGTPTHTFQFFASTANGIIPQVNFIENQTNYKMLSQIMLGFNITIRFY